MTDPRNELADIIVPAAPAMATPAGHSLLLWAAVGLVGVACGMLLAWLWHRRRPARTLHAIAAAAAQQQGTPPALAARLDAWARMRFRLARVDATRCPPGLDPAVWSDWATTLAQVRFAPPPPDGFAVLVSLCESARAWRRHV
ncbi:MAG: hypothetical protein A2199_10500 [Hydrogenophilales bacterium RIFOXYA1_FULL_63_33]|nr:MAG: hypothetical protein A2199_10500 [Hydrogenophilales bacterium RIFOXYA1_FULL_63_33]